MNSFGFEILIGPVVGAVIGYCTNLIAVKMLFFPTREIRIKGIKIPFTPGIIPKERGRIAQKIGRAMGNELFTKDDITNGLLSDMVKEKILLSIENAIRSLQKNQNSLYMSASQYMDREKIDELVHKGKKFIADSIYDEISDMKIDNLIAGEVTKGIKKRLNNSFLMSMVVGERALSEIEQSVEKEVNSYITENGRELLLSKIDNETDEILKKTPAQILNLIDIESVDYGKIALNIYEKMILKYMDKLIREVDIAEIVENKINEMDISEVEDMLVSILKKELTAIVNLGGLIGFILGLIMIFF